MPLKSQAQRAWMHIHHPKMADRWEKHTPKGAKLPKHVGEKHVQSPDGTFLDEMPHLDSAQFGAVDLRIEKYPIPKDDRSHLIQDFQRAGLVGERDGKWLHFRPDYTVREINPKQAADLPHLPKDWDRYAVIVKESRVPAMTEVFR